MTKRPGVLSALFESKSTYLMRQVSATNALLSFPVQNQISAAGFAASCGEGSVLISGGGDDERAGLIDALLQGAADEAPVFVVFGGNPWLSAQALCQRGFNAAQLGTVGQELPGRQQLAILSALDPEPSLSAFWQFAFEVCRALGLPATVETMASIDWQEIDWQRRLLQEAPAEISVDLLERFDKDLAKCAVRASVLLEKLIRGAEQDRAGVAIEEALRTGGIYCSCVPGSASALTRQLFEYLQDAMERGCRFTLILDNVYLKDQAMIKEGSANVRVILSSSDICAAAPDLGSLMQRRFSVALFRHELGGSAEALSAHFFGKYERRYAESSVNTYRNQLSLFSEGIGTSTTVRSGRDFRLNPEWIGRLPLGAAFVRSTDCGEGLMFLELSETGGRRRLAQIGGR